MCSKTDKIPHCNALIFESTHKTASTATRTSTAVGTTVAAATTIPPSCKRTSAKTLSHCDLAAIVSSCSPQRYQSKQPAYLESSNKVRIKSSTLIDKSNYNCHRKFGRFLTLLAIGLVAWHNCIHGACAAPHSCILCDKDDLRAKDPKSSNYEEYFFEHQVTRFDAVNALKALNESYYDGESPKGPSSCPVSCTEKVMKYCLGPQFINDHCWCELGHTDEGLPFVPHICYVGEKVYTASVGSCFFYEEVKDCCCAPALAKQWRHISGASPTLKNSLNLQIAAVLLILFCWSRFQRCCVFDKV